MTELLFRVADSIENDDQTLRLGKALGFKYADIDKYTLMNHVGHHITTAGKRQMLKDWRQKVHIDDQKSRLQDALIRAELLALADEHLGRQRLPSKTPTSACAW